MSLQSSLLATLLSPPLGLLGTFSPGCLLGLLGLVELLGLLGRPGPLAKYLARRLNRLFDRRC